MVQFQEDFLHLVWKYQYFDKKGLATSSGLPLSIQKIGWHNQHEGPDFKEAEIILGGIKNYGHVEIHLKASDWKAHHHHKDPAYNSVVLHVVWDLDEEVFRADGTAIPTLSLSGKVPFDVIRNYEKLLFSPNKLLCSEALAEVPAILKFSMLEKALVERMQEKSRMVLSLLDKNGQDWEETAYQWLFQAFGFKTNAGPMLKLARSLPYKLIKKNAGNLTLVEAMIFGQAGMINPTLGLETGYQDTLKTHFDFLQRKYSLKNKLFGSEWKFMKVRPGNFPSLRLAQLAALLNQTPNLFSNVLYELDNQAAFKDIFVFELSDYWRQHYHFGKSMKRKFRPGLSPAVLDLLAINFVIPLWYAYGRYADLNQWQEKCFNFLQEVSAEKNSLTDIFLAVGWPPGNAFDSQGMLGLYHGYCAKRKCLYCKIGQNLLRPNLK
ncbi:Protein of unknown function [Cyclobacterium lianum]|uniref:DUF2851 domain-containing protein n=1 Tax=Cyclobacterium lianum TaxID=388280 RepID=A0A1M7Q2F5_9BACT|nr:DUF2851 family protein [Cyclobacterium lianum]SHN24448.1 Protein of unknown function [Cyclobacterium lianum]